MTNEVLTLYRVLMLYPPTPNYSQSTPSPLLSYHCHLYHYNRVKAHCEGHLGELICTVAFREDSVAFREHSVAFREHSVAFREHSVAFREHSVAFKKHSVPKAEGTGL